MIIVDILILVFISCFLGLRLWQILGTNHTPRPRKKKSSSPLSHPFGASNTVVRLEEKDVSIEKNPPKKEKTLYPGFDESKFLEGAEKAFLSILQHCYEGDKKSLEKLVTTKMLQRLFHATPKTPQKKMEVEVLSSHIASKKKNGDVARIKVHFTSFQTTNGYKGEVKDLWVFEKNIHSPNPNWVLCDIGANS